MQNDLPAVRLVFDLIIRGNIFFSLLYNCLVGRLASFFCKKLQQKKLMTQFVSFHVGCGTGSSNHFDEIVSTKAANRDPYSQRYAQDKITSDIEMSGFRGKTPEKLLKI